MSEKFFKLLFNDSEGLCYGNFYATKVTTQLPSFEHEFFCINPLHTSKDFGFRHKEEYSEFVPRRADINVTSYRNFLFEMDSLPLKDQLFILQNCGIPFSSIVYSGGKSYHAILSLENALEADYHLDDSSLYYKQIWNRLRMKIDSYAESIGYSLGQNSFIDSSCQNPSRLSRFPNALRKNGSLQTLVHLEQNRISELQFQQILKSCPMVEISNFVQVYTGENATSIEEFWQLCPIGLKNKIKYVDWAGSEGMYPHLYRIACWAIDSTGISKELLIEILQERTFAKLLEAGYPSRKLLVAINHAYSHKRSL